MDGRRKHISVYLSGCQGWPDICRDIPEDGICTSVNHTHVKALEVLLNQKITQVRPCISVTPTQNAVKIFSK